MFVFKNLPSNFRFDDLKNFLSNTFPQYDQILKNENQFILKKSGSVGLLISHNVKSNYVFTVTTSPNPLLQMAVLLFLLPPWRNMKKEVDETISRYLTEKK